MDVLDEGAGDGEVGVRVDAGHFLVEELGEGDVGARAGVDLVGLGLVQNYETGPDESAQQTSSKLEWSLCNGLLSRTRSQFSESC